MSRVHLRIPVVTTGPLAIHTGQEAAGEDTMLRISTDGHPILPGTAIAGALRAAAARRFGAKAADALFGKVATGKEAEERSKADLLTGDPSRITVFDAISPTPAEGQLRHRVGLDRATQSARAGILFDQRAWPQGLRFELRFECGKQDLSALRGAVDELLSPAGGIGSGACGLNADGQAHVGPATTFGHAAVEQARQRWARPETARWPETNDTDLPPARDPETNAAWIQIEVWLHLRSPLAARVPIDISTASKHDNVPFAIESVADGTVRCAVGYPASSLKGKLRQRAEYLCANIGKPAPDPWNTTSGGPHPVQAAYGHAPGGRQHATTEGAAGRVRCSDLLATEHDPRTTQPEPCWYAGPPETHPLVIVRDRVAVDRLAGSTYTSAKFDDTLVRDGVWLVGTIAVVPHLGEELDDTDLALVVASLRDLATGRIGLGGSSHSGYGDVTLVGGRVTERLGKHTTVTDLAPTDDQPVGLPAHLAQRVQDAWSRLREGASA